MTQSHVVWLGLASALLLSSPTLAALDGSTVSPAGRMIGVGLELGAPTTLNAKFMLGAQHGVAVGLGGGIWYDASLSLHGDYLFHPLIIQFDNGSFSGYAGGGLWASAGFPTERRFGLYRPFLKDRQVFTMGARLPLGLNLAFNSLPIEVFIEMVPAVAVFPGLGLFGQGGVGARFYF